MGGSKSSVDCNFEGKLVIFSEGGIYWNVFRPVLEGLIEAKQECIYLTADKQDPGLEMVSEYIESKYLGNMNAAIFSLNRMKARVCVMTTPQLNVLQLKRSKGVRHYCHIMHAPADVHYYDKYAFDDYDSVLCTSRYQIENIRILEEKRGEKKKMLFETGCTYFDGIEAVQRNDVESEPKTVVIAPTWGEKSFLDKWIG